MIDRTSRAEPGWPLGQDEGKAAPQAGPTPTTDDKTAVKRGGEASRARVLADLTETSRAGSVEGSVPIDPRLETGDSGTYVAVEGPVFAEGARYTDIDQGSIADCWLMGGLAAVAHTDPEALQNLIHKNPDGTYTVCFYERWIDRAGKSFFKRHEEVVAPTFPQRPDGRFVYSDPSPNGKPELWVALIEKGYAQWKGQTYDGIAGGQAATAMMAVTGRMATRQTITETTDVDWLYNQLRSASQGDHPIALGTRDDRVSGPLVAWHTYTVVDVFERDGERYVKLYNPFGADDQGVDRHLTFTASEIQQNFKSLYVGDV